MVLVLQGKEHCLTETVEVLLRQQDFLEEARAERGWSLQKLELP